MVGSLMLRFLTVTTLTTRRARRITTPTTTPTIRAVWLVESPGAAVAASSVCVVSGSVEVELEVERVVLLVVLDVVLVDVEVDFVDVDFVDVGVWVGVGVVVGGPLLNLRRKFRFSLQYFIDYSYVHSGVKVMSSTAMSE